ncbi:Oxidoreductase [Seminavis robusta]|uniref:Oxidoreductase n=1 Tax=Seminavis robusta TaxID=568900 RepID=A0A9N8HLD3_9STRA|nr:Oxidoreductase [Seminavis robusta]|eukprot:Sro801_g204430.1 Oxidoreductase (515) ;mRNA; r:9883-11427
MFGLTTGGSAKAKWLVIPFALLAHAWMESIQYNFGKTLRWTPGNIIECTSLGHVVANVGIAKNEGKRVKVLGTGWSWSTTIAGDGDTYLKLMGSFADVSEAEFDLSEPSVVVGAGVRAFDLYLALQDTGYNILAKGNCLARKESQTIGGLLATNVHHAGTATFYDVVEWIDVVTSLDGENPIRTFRDEPLFRLTIGGGGRTGVIVRVKFNLSPRDTYENVQDAVQPADSSFHSFFTLYEDFTGGYERNEFIGFATRFPGVAQLVQQQFTGKRRMAEPSTNPAVMPSNYGDLNFLSKAILKLDGFLDFFLPPFLYEIYVGALLAFVLLGEQPDRDGKVGEDLDLATSLTATIYLKHQELEFFVPRDLIGEVGSYLDSRFSVGKYPYIFKHALFVLRDVYGCNSLTAANGVMSDGTSPDVIAVNIDSYQRSQWKKYNTELNEMMADLSAEFPRVMRTHPGKYNPPLSPDPESLFVKDLIADFDPEGVFARDAYDATYLTSQPRKTDSHSWWGSFWF